VFFKDYGFKVNLKLVDDPVVARDTFAAGESHILWGTLDMIALFAPGLMQDSRTAPRVYQQIDWSSGGDGIVVRGGIQSVRDLKGKTVVYAQNSPSQYFINNLLLAAGIQPSEVKHKYTATAFEAAAAFVADKKIDACVSWAPDIYNIPDKVKNTRILTTTSDANKVIADVWAARADFAKDHPEIIEGLVAGIFDGMQLLRTTPSRPRPSVDGGGYGMAWTTSRG
jgi:NitT/TauT family transport system substrate-binding protein